MTPLDLWPEYEDHAGASLSKTPSHAAPAQYQHLADAENNLSAVDYAVSLLVAFLSRWQDEVQLERKYGHNNATKETADYIYSSDTYKELLKDLQALLLHLQKEHPFRDPLFLKQTEEVRGGSVRWTFVENILTKHLREIQNAFSEEVKIGKDFTKILKELSDYSRQVELEENSSQKTYHDLFYTNPKNLQELIMSSSKTAKQIRAQFFPLSIEEDKEQHSGTKEKRHLWGAMWELWKKGKHDTPAREKFSWLQKRGANIEPDA
jgi:hypothetical protein